MHNAIVVQSGISRKAGVSLLPGFLDKSLIYRSGKGCQGLWCVNNDSYCNAQKRGVSTACAVPMARTPPDGPSRGINHAASH
jgi:hypothetical protein